MSHEIGSDRMNLPIAVLAVPDQEREGGIRTQPVGEHERSLGLLDVCTMSC
jgi:hypothetical protein